MARIQINDLPVLENMSQEELLGIFGGLKIKFKAPGKFQQKVIASAAVGAASGAAFGSVLGPAGTAAGAIGGAAASVVTTTLGNHAEKKWTGGGLNNWKKPSRW